MTFDRIKDRVIDGVGQEAYGQIRKAGAKIGSRVLGNSDTRALSIGAFYVKTNDFSMVFSGMSGLKFETELFPYEQGGENDRVRRFPGRTKTGNLILKRGIANTQQFLMWYQKIISGQIERQHITVEIRDTHKDPIVQWMFHNAYPVAWSGPDFTAGESTLAIESLELAHDGIIEVK
jgi:phage tail-like protein